MHTLEIRHVDLRGPAFLGELITSGPCGVFDPILLTVDANLSPFDPPTEPIRVLLYVNGKYAGFATLGPDGFLPGEGETPPWFTIRSLLS